jgi:hypothetical protein
MITQRERDNFSASANIHDKQTSRKADTAKEFVAYKRGIAGVSDSLQQRLRRSRVSMPYYVEADRPLSSWFVALDTANSDRLP